MPAEAAGQCSKDNQGTGALRLSLLYFMSNHFDLSIISSEHQLLTDGPVSTRRCFRPAVPAGAACGGSKAGLTAGAPSQFSQAAEANVPPSCSHRYLDPTEPRQEAAADSLWKQTLNVFYSFQLCFIIVTRFYWWKKENNEEQVSGFCFFLVLVHVVVCPLGSAAAWVFTGDGPHLVHWFIGSQRRIITGESFSPRLGPPWPCSLRTSPVWSEFFPLCTPTKGLFCPFEHRPCICIWLLK